MTMLQHSSSSPASSRGACCPSHGDDLVWSQERERNSIGTGECEDGVFKGLSVEKSNHNNPLVDVAWINMPREHVSER